MTELQRVRVEPTDLVLRHTPPQLIFLATFWGFTGVAAWSGFYGPVLSNYAYIGAAIGFGLLGLFANQFKSLLAGSDFTYVTKIQRGFSMAYLVAGLSVNSLILAGFFVRPPYGVYLRFDNVTIWAPIIFTMGIGFFTLGLTIGWLRLLDPNSESRLSLKHFLETGDKKWLGHGLELTQRRLSSFGLRLARGTLALGASFGMANGDLNTSDVEEIATWLEESNAIELPDTLSNLVIWAKKAQFVGFHRPRNSVDYLLETRNSVQIAVGLVSFVSALLTIAHALGWL